MVSFVSYSSPTLIALVVGAFNQEKALVGAFSVIVKTDCETDGSSAALVMSGYYEDTRYHPLPIYILHFGSFSHAHGPQSRPGAGWGELCKISDKFP